MNKEMLKIMKQLPRLREAAHSYEQELCPFCHKIPNKADLKDELSKREFEISGLCMTCQDKFFKKQKKRRWQMDNLELSEIGQFTGTHEYHKVSLFKTVVTDGVKYIMENGYSWFVTDSLAFIEGTPALRKLPFISIKLDVLGEGVAQVVIGDGDVDLHTQECDFTDAKQDIILFWDHGVLMLASEY